GDLQDEVVLKRRYLQCGLAIFTVIASLVAHQSDHKNNVHLPLGKSILWIDPGDASLLDFEYGAGGSERQPQAPFRFVDEDMSGTHAKINVTDARGALWNIKWGSEATPSTFCTRLVWACGYFVEPEYFVARGRIEGVHGLKRAKSRVEKDGSFVDARFQLRSGPAQFLENQSWTWTSNPFVKTPQLQ